MHPVKPQAWALGVVRCYQIYVSSQAGDETMSLEPSLAISRGQGRVGSVSGRLGVRAFEAFRVQDLRV